MTRLSAKIEIEVTSLATRSIRKVPTIARPADQGAAAARRPGCGRTAARAGRGGERRAARRGAGRDSTCLFTCSEARAGPPSVTPGLPSSDPRSLDAASCACLVVGRLQGYGEIGRAAVLGDEGLRAGVVVVGDPPDRRVSGDPRGERLNAVLRLPARTRRPRNQGDDAEVPESGIVRGGRRPGRSRSPGRRRRRDRACWRRPRRACRRRPTRSAPMTTVAGADG